MRPPIPYRKCRQATYKVPPGWPKPSPARRSPRSSPSPSSGPFLAKNMFLIMGRSYCKKWRRETIILTIPQSWTEKFLNVISKNVNTKKKIKILPLSYSDISKSDQRNRIFEGVICKMVPLTCVHQINFFSFCGNVRWHHDKKMIAYRVVRSIEKFPFADDS